MDLGYRGVDYNNPDVKVIHRGRIKSMSAAEKKVLKRRQAVEPAVGHIKHDNRMIHCYLKGSIGYALNAISCAAGYNIRWLMRAIRRLGLKGLFASVFLIVARLILRRFALTIRLTTQRIRSQQDYVTLPEYFVS